MDAPVIAALIAASAAVIVGVANNINKTLERKKLKAEIKKLEEVSATVVEEIMESRLGYRVRELTSDTSFDENGDSVSQRRWVDLTVTKPTSNLRVEFRCRTTGVTDEPVVTALPGSNNQVYFERKPGRTPDSVIEGWAVVMGNLMPGHPISFEVSYPTKGAFATSEEEMRLKYKDDKCLTEYAVTDANVSADLLTRKIFFPPSHRNLSPPPQPAVFFGAAENEEPDFQELERVQRWLTVTPDSAALQVRDPKPGRRYGISWTPPRRAPKKASPPA